MGGGLLTQVIAVCMNEEDTEKLRERGAWSTMAYSESQMMAVVSKLTKKQGVDVVYDTLAGEVLKSCLKWSVSFFNCQKQHPS